MITREELLRPMKRRYAEIHLPVAGAQLRIQNLSERERSQYESYFTTKKGDINPGRLRMAKCRLAVLAIVDESGARLLSDDDAEQLLEMDSADMNKLWAAIRDHCGFDEEDLQELVGNCEATRACESPTN